METIIFHPTIPMLFRGTVVKTRERPSTRSTPNSNFSDLWLDARESCDSAPLSHLRNALVRAVLIGEIFPSISRLVSFSIRYGGRLLHFVNFNSSAKIADSYKAFTYLERYQENLEEKKMTLIQNQENQEKRKTVL